MRSGSRLVASMVSPGAERSSASASAALAPSRCSQLSRTSSSAARREEVDERVDDVLSGQRPHVERRGDGVRHEPRIGQRGELDERRAVRVGRLGGAGELEREPRLAGAAGPGERQQAGVAEQRAQLGELAPAADERARVGREPARPVRGPEGGELLGELRGQLGELVAPARRPVVVAVLRQQLAAVDRERGAVGGRRSRAARVRRGELEPVDVDVRGEEEHLVPNLDRVRRRARAARRAPPGGGCSPPPPARGRATARPSPARDAAGDSGASASSFTSSRAFFSRHAFSGTGSPSTAAEKPPRSVTVISGTRRGCPTGRRSESAPSRIEAGARRWMPGVEGLASTGRRAGRDRSYAKQRRTFMRGVFGGRWMKCAAGASAIALAGVAVALAGVLTAGTPVHVPDNPLGGSAARGRRRTADGRRQHELPRHRGRAPRGGDPTNPMHLVAAFQQDRWNDGGVNGLTRSVSTDGGTTWISRPASRRYDLRRCRPGSPGLLRPRHRPVGELLLRRRIAYLISDSFNANGPAFGGTSSILVSRRPTAATTGRRPVAAQVDTSTTVLNDKESVTADPTDPHGLRRLGSARLPIVHANPTAFTHSPRSAARPCSRRRPTRA